MRYLFIALTLIAMVWITATGGEANDDPPPAYVVNTVTPKCRHFLFDAERAKETRRGKSGGTVAANLVDYGDCLTVGFEEYLTGSSISVVADVDRLVDEVRLKVVSIERNCLPNEDVARFRAETERRIASLHAQDAPLMNLRLQVISDYRVDVERAFKSDLLPSFQTLLAEAGEFARQFGTDYAGEGAYRSPRPYDKIVEAHHDLNRLFGVVNERIVLREDCDPTVTDLSGRWTNGRTHVAILRRVGNSYEYEGRDDEYKHKHEGKLRAEDVDSEGRRIYESYGFVRDVPGFCCGNVGQLEIVVINDDCLQVKSRYWQFATEEEPEGWPLIEHWKRTGQGDGTSDPCG